MDDNLHGFRFIKILILVRFAGPGIVRVLVTLAGRGVVLYLAAAFQGKLVVLAVKKRNGRRGRGHFGFGLWRSRNEEWFRAPATLKPGMKASARIPEGATHYLINLIDANNFYPITM